MEFLSITAALPILIASFLGSPHCLGMCGGFVAIYSRGTSHKILPHVLYSLGRLCTYLSLGLAAAFAGASFNSMVSTVSLQSASALLVGSTLISFGLLQLIRGRVAIASPVFASLATFVRRFSEPIFERPTRLTPFLIGLVTTCLPCGWLYTFVAQAFAAATPLEACSIMFLFWLGTLPAMLALGATAAQLIRRVGRFIPRITAILLIVSGLISLNLHISHQHHAHSHTEHQH